MQILVFGLRSRQCNESFPSEKLSGNHWFARYGPTVQTSVKVWQAFALGKQELMFWSISWKMWWQALVSSQNRVTDSNWTGSVNWQVKIDFADGMPLAVERVAEAQSSLLHSDLAHLAPLPNQQIERAPALPYLETWNLEVPVKGLAIDCAAHGEPFCIVFWPDVMGSALEIGELGTWISWHFIIWTDTICIYYLI